MNTQQALSLYNQIKGTSHDEKDLQYLEVANRAVEAIKDIGTGLENIGASLRSRQTIATIIYFAENQN